MCVREGHIAVMGDISELPGSQSKRGNRLSLNLDRHVFLAVCGGASSRGSDRAMCSSQTCTAVLSRAPGPGVASVGQQQLVLSAIGADNALGSQQVLSMEGHWWAGAAAWRPHILEGLQWRAVLIDKLHTDLIAGLLGLAEVAQHSSPEHCG